MKDRFLVLLVVWTILGTNGGWFALFHPCVQTRENQEILGYRDTDVQLIEGGLRGKTTRQTLDWWTNTWCGQVPFYRPVTSYLFWFEHILFGPKRYQLWLAVALLSHLVAVLLGYFLLKKVFGNVIAFSTMALFAGPPIIIPSPGYVLLSLDDIKHVAWGVGWSFGGEHFTETLPFWKNSVDYWAAIAVFGAMLAFVNSRLVLTLILYAIALCTKEVAYGLLPLLGALAYYQRRRIPTWFWFVASGMTCMFFLMRYLTIGGLGYRLEYRGGAHWWMRAVSDFGGAFTRVPIEKALEGAIIGLCIVGIVKLIQVSQSTLLRRLLAIPCALGVGWIGIALFLKATCMNGKPVNTYFEILASVEPPWPLMGVIALTILIPMAIRRFHRESVLGFVWWVSFSLGLYIAPQTTKHTWYIADVGRSLLFVLSMVGFIDFLRAQQTSGGTLPPGVLFYFNNMR